MCHFTGISSKPETKIVWDAASSSNCRKRYFLSFIYVCHHPWVCQHPASRLNGRSKTTGVLRHISIFISHKFFHTKSKILDLLIAVIFGSAIPNNWIYSIEARSPLFWVAEKRFNFLTKSPIKLHLYNQEHFWFYLSIRVTNSKYSLPGHERSTHYNRAICKLKPYLFLKFFS